MSEYDMTSEQYRIKVVGRKKNKYGAVKTMADGIVFDSKREAARYLELKVMQKAGEIHDLEMQPVYTLQQSFRDNQGNVHRAITYRADFQYYQNGEVVVEDVKGKETAVFKLKKKLFIKKYPELILRVTK